MEIVNSRVIPFGPGHRGGPRAESVNPFEMLATRPEHMRSGRPKPPEGDVAGNFGQLLAHSLGQVDRLDNEAHELTAKAVYAPDSVELHEVVVAAEKARLALTFTKSMADAVVRTFRDLTNPR